MAKQAEIGDWAASKLAEICKRTGWSTEYFFDQIIGPMFPSKFNKGTNVVVYVIMDKKGKARMRRTPK